jgi:hypothetical protein
MPNETKHNRRSSEAAASLFTAEVLLLHGFPYSILTYDEVAPMLPEEVPKDFADAVWELATARRR